MIHGAINRQIKELKDDPWLLGWSVGNELDLVVTEQHVRQLLSMPAEAPAKVSLIDYAVVTMYQGSLDRLKEAWKVEVPNRIALYRLTPAPPPEDMEKLRRFLADKFHAFILPQQGQPVCQEVLTGHVGKP